MELSFSHVIPIFWKSRKKEIDMEDLYAPLDAHKSDLLGEKMCAAWDKELAAAKAKNRDPSLLKAGLRVFGWQITLLGIILAAIELLLR